MDAPSRQDVERQLRLVLSSHEFAASPKLSELLYYLVTETLAGKVLDVLAFMSGDAKRRVSVPLKFDKGIVYLGPAPIAKITPEPASAQLAPVDPALP